MELCKFILVVTILKCHLSFGFSQEPVISSLTPPAPQNEKLQELIKILEGCGLREQEILTKQFLKNGNATCNDGSPAGYYFRKSHGSKKWIVFLEGGWYCYDSKSCQSRWNRMKHLMSSTQWPDVKYVAGILSPNPEDNPFWWNANHVYIPYCTSDAWSGRRDEPFLIENGSKFTFMGAIIIEQIIAELLTFGLKDASSLILAGSSAGGAGVMLNIESVQHQLKPYPNILVRGISDSGWFLDRTPYPIRQDPLVQPIESIKLGLVLWNGKIPHSCKKHYTKESWRCFFGYRLYPTIKAPIFIFQWLFDEAQMVVDNVGAPFTKHQWDYVHNTSGNLRDTFENVTYVFAPACISHAVLTKKNWQLLTIDNVNLPKALRCWEQATQKTHKRLFRNHGMMADDPGKRRKHRRNHGVHKNETKANDHQTKKKNRRNRNKKQKGKSDKSIERDLARKTRAAEPSCNRKLIEKCTWPQCNISCPKIFNPFTGEEMQMDIDDIFKYLGMDMKGVAKAIGEEMDLIEVLKSMGLDMRGVAVALGLDYQTLENMDHVDLLNLLTQHDQK